MNEILFQRSSSKSSPASPVPNEDSFGRLAHKKKEDKEENGSLKLLSRSIYCESIQSGMLLK